MIRLDESLERDDYWQEVRQKGDERLTESGYDDWVVTVRPRSGAHDEAVAVNVSVATRLLDIAVHEQPELPPESFIQTSIIDVIEHAIGARRDEGDEDPLRDEGGEA
jgi:hypothetical protein